jgi:hypothetical protein
MSGRMNGCQCAHGQKKCTAMIIDECARRHPNVQPNNDLSKNGTKEDRIEKEVKQQRSMQRVRAAYMRVG